MSILGNKIRWWWIEKPLDNNMPIRAAFEAFAPTIKTRPETEWIRVISLDDFHKEAGMNITRWVEVCNQLATAQKEASEWKVEAEKYIKAHGVEIITLNKQTDRIKHLEQELEELKKTKGLDYLKEVVLERNLKLEQFLLEMTDILIEVEDILEVVRTPDHPIVKYSELLREIKGEGK